LCTSSFQNGDPLTLQTTNPGWGNSTSEAYCWYNNNQSYEADYCKLYNWYAATDPRELCPVGWRVPTASDWQQLVGYLDPTCNPCTNGASTAVNALKESGSLLWLIDNSESTNASGFSARAAGRRDGGGSFNTIGETVYFWTSTPSGSQSKGVYFFYDDFNLVDFDEDWGMSIRCIKD
ncbi:fibrobacter succinogenes major paralogous domain-containing protein, partial [Flavobacteriales bacterium]|nr:fibrobacter succinogenes major paralogous domain-containing protein [Flavobacteriales bacterium]